MKHTQNDSVIMESWRRCAQAGISPDSEERLYPLMPQALRERCEELRPAISAFERCLSGVSASLPGAASVLLLDGQGVLLKKNTLQQAIPADQAGLLFRGDTCGDQRGRAVHPDRGVGLDSAPAKLLHPAG